MFAVRCEMPENKERVRPSSKTSFPNSIVPRTLVVLGVAWFVSVLSSSHVVYVPPVPIGTDPAVFSAIADPRHLPSTTDLSYSIGYFATAGGSQRLENGPITVTAPAAARITGWAFDAKNDVPAHALYLQIDRLAIRSFPIDVARPDVAAAFKSINRLNSGFRADLSLPALRPGPHHLEIWITNADESAIVHPAAQTLIVTRASGERR